MTRSNKKAGHGDHINQISDLPSNVIDGILEHLHIVDRVRTSILSRKWRYMWASVPQLEFDEIFFEKYAHLGDIAIFSIITDVLLLHNGPIYKFTLEVPPERRIGIERLNKWILYLSRSGIKELVLVVEQESPNPMPSHVFSCHELTFLQLLCVRLSVAPNFCCFKSLLELHLYNMYFEPGVLESLISVCPVLEKLTILCSSGIERIDFPAPTLKFANIETNRVLKSFCLKKAKNLIDLKLSAGWDNEERVSASDLIKGLPKVQRLAMGSHYMKILSAGTIPQLLLRRAFRSLEYVELNILDLNEKEFLFIVGLLKSAPKLVELVIIEGQNDRVRSQDQQDQLDQSEMSECSGCCLSQLQTVNIKVRLESTLYAMNLMRFILANSSSLKTLTVEVGSFDGLTDGPLLLRFSQDLLGMKRASQSAEVKFIHENLVW